MFLSSYVCVSCSASLIVWYHKVLIIIILSHEHLECLLEIAVGH